MIAERFDPVTATNCVSDRDEPVIRKLLPRFAEPGEPGDPNQSR